MTHRKGLCGEWITVPGFGDRFFSGTAHENSAVRTWLIARFRQPPMSLTSTGATTLANNMGFRSSGTLTATHVNLAAGFEF